MSARDALARQQSALLAAIFDRRGSPIATNLIATNDHFTLAFGLNVYKNNHMQLAPKVLAAAYPVLVQLMGAEGFEGLARALWAAHPPERGDLAHWGAALSQFLIDSGQIAGEPYLPDVATLEWSLHQCATAPDAPQHRDTLALLMSHDPMNLRMRLAPGTAVLPSVWPIASIVLAHQSAAENEAPDLSAAAEMMQTGQGETALVWREGFKPRVRVCLPGEAAFVSALLAKHSLGRALEQAPALDFNTWLARAVPDGLWISAVAQ